MSSTTTETTATMTTQDASTPQEGSILLRKFFQTGLGLILMSLGRLLFSAIACFHDGMETFANMNTS
eukprot:scaffold25753_cov33-Cyclotella_meneghiniana.AAC.1